MTESQSNQTVSRKKAEQIINEMFDKRDTHRFNILMGIRDGIISQVTERRNGNE